MSLIRSSQLPRTAQQPWAGMSVMFLARKVYCTCSHSFASAENSHCHCMSSPAVKALLSVLLLAVVMGAGALRDGRHGELLAGVGVLVHLHYRFALNYNLSHQKRSGNS